MPAPASRLDTAAWWVTAAVAAVFLSCSQQTPEQELLKKAEPVGSWLASLQMAAEKWAGNSVPSAFVRSTAEAARDDFEQAAREANRSAAGPAVREPFRRLLAESRAACDQLRRAAAENDRSAAQPLAKRLAALQAELAELRKARGEPSS